MKHALYRRFARFLVSAVTGRSKLGVTIFVYSVFAALLLAYVSAQIYAGCLRAEIKNLEQQRLASKEAFNKLTGLYVEVSSRQRIADYCVNVLKMVPVGENNLEIVAVRSDVAPNAAAGITRKPEALPSPQRYTWRRSERNVGQ